MVDILNQISNKNLIDTVQWLTKETPYRLAGSPDQKKAGEYIVNRMESFGIHSELQEFYAYNSIPHSSSFEILGDYKKTIDSLPCAHIRSTSSGGKVFDLIFVGSGSVEEYSDIDAKGKAVLVEVSYSPPVPEKARIAAENGAAAIVFMNWGNDEGVICHRGLKGVWGNPTERTFLLIPDIIGVSITRVDGLKLKNLCIQNGSIPVRITAEADRTWSKLHQPFGILKGNGKSEEIIVVASHLDAWCPGVTCNATGNATTLEIARILAKNRDKLIRNVYFVFWSGHEIAEAAGSTWFLDNHWYELNKYGIAYIHIDSTGVLGTKLFEIKASPELIDFAKKSVTEYDSELELRTTLLKRIGDQSFMGIGIPSITQRYSFTDADISAANGATLGWWNHTREDGIDKCNPEILYKDTLTTLQLIYRLATIEKLPYSLATVFEDIDSRLNILESQYSCAMDFKQLRISFENMRLKVLEACKMLEDKSLINSYNRLVIKSARILSPLIQTYSGKYEQDSYGLNVLTFPIPLLFDLERIKKERRGTLKYGLLETQLRRNFNKLTDSMEDLREYADLLCEIET